MKDKVVDYRAHAEQLSERVLNLIKSILIKHDSTILEEIHTLVKENQQMQCVIEAARRIAVPREALWGELAKLDAMRKETK